MDLRLILWVASSVTPRAVLHSALLPPSWRVCPCSLPRPRATSKCAVSPSQAGFLALTAGLSQKLTTYDSFSCVGVRASSEGAPDGLPPRCLAGVSAHALRCGLRVGVVGVPLRVTGRCSSSQCLPCPEGSQGGGQPRRNLFSNTIHMSRSILDALGIRSSCPQSRYTGLCRPLLPCRARMPHVPSSAPARRLRHGYKGSQRPASPAWGSHGIGACDVAVARHLTLPLRQAPPSRAHHLLP